MGIQSNDDTVRFEVRYLTSGDDIAFGHALKTTAQVGVCGLDIFRLVFRERYDILGLSEELRAAMVDL